MGGSKDAWYFAACLAGPSKGVQCTSTDRHIRRKKFFFHLSYAESFLSVTEMNIN